MKKFILPLLIALPFIFFSCEDSTEISGALEIDIAGQKHVFPMTTFIKDDKNTVITSTMSSNTVTMSFNDTVMGTYPVGYVAEYDMALPAITENINNIPGYLLSEDEAIVFYPTDNNNDAFVAICGSIVVESYTKDQITGTFSGSGIHINEIAGLLTEEVGEKFTAGKKDFTGKFTAIRYGIVK